MILRVFNLEDAKRMDVVTRDGRPVEILTVDKRLLQPIIAVLDSGEGLEAETFCANGMYCTHGTETEHDLFLTPKKIKAMAYIFSAGPGHSRVDIRHVGFFGETDLPIRAGEKLIAKASVVFTEGEGLQP